MLTRTRTALPIIGQDAELGADAAEFHQALSDLVRVYQFRDRDRICCYDISVTQCYALEAIAEKGPLSLNDLAAVLYLDKSTASRVVATLERKGYVERKSDPDDRRAIRIIITREGRALYRRIEGELLDQEKHLIADFDPAVRKGMTQLIRRLARAAEARVQTSGGSCCLID